MCIKFTQTSWLVDQVKLHLIVHRVQDMNMHVSPADLTPAVDALKAEITLRLEPEYALNHSL